ncbi:MAG: hypothetical protein LC737_02990 [Chloroflexi bacterium]|nr:hypothetical protein [Chloroflexota bacterium]
MNPPNVPGPSNLPPNEPREIPPSQPMPPPPPLGGGTPPPSSGGGIPPYNPPPAGRGGLFSGRNIILGLLGLLGLCCVCGALTFFVVLPRLGTSLGGAITDQLQTQVPGGLDTIQVTAVGTDFMTRLKNGDWNGAYNLCTPELQKELGSAANLNKRITDGKAQPASWSFADFSSITPTSSDAQIDGTATFSGNRTGTLRLVLDRVGANQWKISGFNLQPK